MLEEQLDRNSSHPAVAPIYFPQELARLDSLQRDLEHFFGSNWRNSVIVPAATYKYEERLKKVSREKGAQWHISRGPVVRFRWHFHIFQIGEESPELLVAHAYTRYLGDLSGGQVLGKITQKSLGLSNKDGLSFFYFPGVTSPNRFKQLYRSRMNSIELSEEQKAAVLQEAVNAFELNIQVGKKIGLKS